MRRLPYGSEVIAMREILKQLGTSTLISLLVVMIVGVSIPNPKPRVLLTMFSISLTYSICIGMLAWWVAPKLIPRIRGTAAVRWLQIGALFFTLGLVGGALAYAVMVLQPFFKIHMNFLVSMAICIVITMTVGAILYLIEQLRHRMQATTLELRTRELERERALKAASEAKLQSLESRIQPHFLFNTLNSISSLVRSNPEAAEEMIGRLADLLRFSLDRHGSLVSLEDELKITRDYLAIEAARFGSRLQFAFDIPDELLAAKVPALSLQTLVENSVKYAVSTQRGGAAIRLRAKRESSAIHFAVSDTGPGFSPDSLPQGHGLDTLRQRLETLFGSGAKLTAKRLDPGMEVEFCIPC